MNNLWLYINFIVQEDAGLESRSWLVFGGLSLRDENISFDKTEAFSPLQNNRVILSADYNCFDAECVPFEILFMKHLVNSDAIFI